MNRMKNNKNPRGAVYKKQPSKIITYNVDDDAYNSTAQLIGMNHM